MPSSVVLHLLAFQIAAASPPENGALVAPTSYLDRYGQVMALGPFGERTAIVKDLVISRDVARFTLSAGTLSLLTPIDGRVVGAVFQGQGTFEFLPPTRIELDRLVLFEKTSGVSTPFTSLVLFFADTTARELESKLEFGVMPTPEGARALVRKSLEYLADDDTRAFEPDLMASFLNGERNDLFYAHVGRAGKPLLFMLNPFETEGVSLSTRAPRWTWSRRPEVICRFARHEGVPDTARSERRDSPTIRNYRIDATLAQTAMSGLAFSASARIEVTAPAAVGPWVALELFSSLRVDSARTDDGRPVAMFRGKDSDQLWIRLDRRIAAGDVLPVVLYYGGDLIERDGDSFYIRSSIAWYPRPLEGRSYATFDITYHSPSHYLITSVGEKRDSSVTGRILTTRWATPQPIRNASFNLGLFKAHRVAEPDAPPLTLLVSDRERRYTTDQVAADLLQSLKFFQRVYGSAPVKQLHAAEIPYFHGEAFPGLLNLSWVTFVHDDGQGESEVFRAHEVAHQWWGIGVDFATYHDQWLSEGLSDFSGLWYLHAARRDSDRYFGLLRRWRTNIMDKRDDPSPIWLGYRTSTASDDARFLIYQKGAWVMHMLRVLMLELRTAREDRFTAMMQDFYRSFQGRRASTEDFRQIVERHIGMDMGWFFNQWVYGTDIPTYRVAHRSEPAENGQYRVTLRVAQENVAEDFRMFVPVTVDLGDGRQGRFRVNVQGRESTIPLPLLPGRPRTVKFNELEGVLADVKMVAW
jgi:hypothetical protein